MEQTRKRIRRTKVDRIVAPLMSELELARLGDGRIAYIKKFQDAK